MANEKFTLGVGAAHEFEIAFRKVGGTNTDFTRMTQDEETLRQILAVVRRTATVETVRHLVDCDADPFVPEGWAVEEHRRGGTVDLGAAKPSLFLAGSQKKGRIGGHDLRKVVADQPVLNANVLDYLLANPELIPNEWKGKAVFFWGTIYRNRGGLLYVRYLCWNGGRWDWFDRWLVDDWDSDDPAACGQASA